MSRACVSFPLYKQPSEVDPGNLTNDQMNQLQKFVKRQKLQWEAQERWDRMCDCECHDNPGIRHIVPCCNFCYQQRPKVVP